MKNRKLSVIGLFLSFRPKNAIVKSLLQKTVIEISSFLMISLFILSGNQVVSENIVNKSRSYLIKEKFEKLNPNSSFLAFHGKVIQAKDWELGIAKRLDSASIVVVNESKQIVSKVYSNKAGMFRLKLPLNHQYTIRVSKKSWATKIILVDTRIIKPKNRCYYFPFDVYIFEDIPSVDASILKEPIARVVYNNYLNRFYYNHAYTDHVNELLKKLYSAYYRYRAKNDTLNRHDHYGRIVSIKRSNKNNQRSVEFKKEATGEVSLSEKHKTDENISSNTISEPDRKSRMAIVFKIQILSLAGKIPMCAKVFERCGRVAEYVHNNEYKYTIGEFNSLESAMLILNQIRAKGYKDAFPVAFINGKRITVTEACQLTGKNKTSPI